MELDDRIPYLSKLRHWTGVKCGDGKLKGYEIDICESLEWKLQGLTFYDYVEHFLMRGVVLDGDLVGVDFLDCFRYDKIDMAEDSFYENL